MCELVIENSHTQGMLVSLHCLIDRWNLCTYSNMAINDSAVEQLGNNLQQQVEGKLQQCQKYSIKNKCRELLSFSSLQL